MILTVDEFRQFHQTDETDFVLQAHLEAIEQMILKHTHNNFRKYQVEGVIRYPADVKMGVIELLKWKLEYGNKVGIASESLSRHSVTYANMTGDDFIMGYPKAKMGFLKPYMKAYFGQGLSV